MRNACDNLTNEEIKIYKSSLKSLAKSDKKLLLFYYSYPLEFKLRMFKQKYFG